MKSVHPTFPPLITAMLKKRSDAIILSIVLFFQVGLTYFGIPGWQCPIFQVTGIPCPGCGLSRAALLLLQGKWQTALKLHVFAPLVLVVGLLFITAAILPKQNRQKYMNYLEVIELRTGASLFALIGLIVYWIARIIINWVDYLSLITNL